MSERGFLTGERGADRAPIDGRLLGARRQSAAGEFNGHGPQQPSKAVLKRTVCSVPNER